MPNWCWNTLDVSGPSEDIQRFKVTANGPVQSYHNYRPTGGEWPIHDDVRLKALSESLPEPGEISVFSFHALFPVPDEVRQLPYDGTQAKEVAEMLGRTYASSGYNWEISNWGCKWGCSEPELLNEENSYLGYSFETPWAPPINFLTKIAADWPTLCFELHYEEAGMGFAGEAEFYDGEFQGDNCYDLPQDDEEEDDCDE